LSSKILVVDHSLYNRMVLRDILISHGFSVLEASTGDEAIELYRQLHPDLVTVEASMPGFDGARTVREVLLIDPDAPVLMCGSHGQRSAVMEGMACGAEGVLLKPFKEKQVVRVVRQSMRQPPPGNAR